MVIEIIGFGLLELPNDANIKFDGNSSAWILKKVKQTDPKCVTVTFSAGTK